MSCKIYFISFFLASKPQNSHGILSYYLSNYRGPSQDEIDARNKESQSRMRETRSNFEERRIQRHANATLSGEPQPDPLPPPPKQKLMRLG